MRGAAEAGAAARAGAAAKAGATADPDASDPHPNITFSSPHINQHIETSGHHNTRDADFGSNHCNVNVGSADSNVDRDAAYSNADGATGGQIGRAKSNG